MFEQILTDFDIPYNFITDRCAVFTYTKKGALSDDKDTYIQVRLSLPVSFHLLQAPPYIHLCLSYLHVLAC